MVRRTLGAIVPCIRCSKEFKRETRDCKICDKCKEKSKALGLIKRRATIKKRKAHKLLDANLIALREETGRGYEKQWMIVDSFGNVLRKDINSKWVAQNLMKGLKISPREDLRVVCQENK